MNQFQFNYLTKQLWKIEEGNFREIPQEQKFTTQFNGLGFCLDLNQPQHWISFTIYSEKIKAFYKQVSPKETLIYYQLEQSKQEITKWDFTYLDIVEKIDGKWQYRNI